MKKITIFINVLLIVMMVFSGCEKDVDGSGGQNPKSSEISSSTSSGGQSSDVISEESSGAFEFNVLGKFICSNDYYKEGNFIKFPEWIPSITFYEDGSCKFMVNYLEGLCDVGGVYNVDGSNIQVELDLSNTIFEEDGIKYMYDQYVFTIVSNDEIIIDRGYYAVNTGDSFVRSAS